MKIPATDIVLIFNFFCILTAFVFHKYISKKLFPDRKKLSNVILEFVLQTIGYVVIPSILIIVFQPYLIKICGKLCENSKFPFTSLLSMYLLDFGWIWNSNLWLIIGGFYIISLPFLAVGLKFKKLNEEYPLWKDFHLSPLKCKIKYEIIYLLYYINWEFFFRGVLLLFVLTGSGCKQLPEFIIYNTFQTIFAGLFHYDKPLPEFLLAFPANFIFGVIAFISGSIVPSILIHYFIGLTFDVWVSNRKTRK